MQTVINKKGDFSISSGTKRHSRENGNPENPKKHWIPAFARMMIKIFKKLPELIEKLVKKKWKKAIGCFYGIKKIKVK